MNWNEPLTSPGICALLLTVSIFTFSPCLAKMSWFCATHRKPKADDGPGVAMVTEVSFDPDPPPEPVEPSPLDEQATRPAPSATAAMPIPARLHRVASSADELMIPPSDR